MSDTDKVENVKVELQAKISIDKWSDDVVLVSVDRREQGQFTLDTAMALLRSMADTVISRCGSRMDERIADSRRQITVGEHSES